MANLQWMNNICQISSVAFNFFSIAYYVDLRFDPFYLKIDRSKIWKKEEFLKNKKPKKIGNAKEPLF